MAYPLLHNDDPAATDGLQRQALADEIATLAATTTPPVVLGVHGDWGSGKTSFMQHVRQQLDKNHKKAVVTVWFEAWRYQNEPAPVVALLHEMRRRFSPPKKASNAASKIAEVTFRSLLSSFDQVAKLIGIESLPVSPDKIQAIGESWEKQHLETTLVTDEIQQFLEHAITGLLQFSSKTRVVIFIDDLDRCNADMAYKLLEGLKIYLNLKNCVFVLGMNQQIIIKAIASVLKKDDDDARVRLEAEAYLEKLCANIWRLPPPKDVYGYFTSLLDQAYDIPINAIKAAAIDSRLFLPPNPRRLKALANLYNRLWLRAMQSPSFGPNYSEAETLALRILVVAYLYQFHTELFQRWRHDPAFLEKLRLWMQKGESELVRTKDNKEVFDPCFFALILPTFARATDNPNSPTPGPIQIISNYPDPSAPGVFWIAPLLQQALAMDLPIHYQDLLNLEQA